MKHHLLCVLLAGTLCLAGRTVASAADAADWPSFRGSPDMRGVAQSELPAKPELLWTHEAGSKILSSAAIAGDSVYVGTEHGEVLSLALADGKLRWKFDASEPISASPCVVNGAVYIGDEGGIFHALDAATGKELWHFDTKDKIISSATPAPGVILFGSYDYHLYCLDAKTGAKRWAFKTDSFVHCSPCVAGDVAMIAGCDGLVRFISIASGRQVTAQKVEGNFAACPAFDREAALVGDMSGRFFRVPLLATAAAWRFEDEDGGGAYAGAALSDNSVIFASRASKVFSCDRKTGRILWTAATKGPVNSSPVIVPQAGDDGPRVFFGSDDGTLHALRLKDGKVTWNFAAGAPITASPAVAHGRLVIGTEDGAICCFGAKDKIPPPPRVVVPRIREQESAPPAESNKP